MYPRLYVAVERGATNQTMPLSEYESEPTSIASILINERICYNTKALA
jgi:hypothetical protein